jgi:outer membrane protein insertion porin family
MIYSFFKNFFSLIFILALTLSIAQSEIINEIQIEGNNRVNSETVKIFGEVSPGDDLNSNDLNNILKNLYETNFFENVELKIENSILKIKIKENPIIQNLIVQGIKNKDLLKKIESAISLKEKNPYLESNIEYEIRNVKNLIQSVGYYFPSVDLLTKINNNNTIDLIFDINLGDKAYINEIVFLGDKVFKKRKLLNVITSEEDRFWKFVSSKRLLNKQRIELDKRLLLNFYKNKGYYNVSILNETVEFDDTQNFNVVFNIDSGNKYYFGNFNIDLPEAFDEKYFVEIDKKLKTFSGEKYSLKIVEKMLSEIEKMASGKQYEFINAAIEENIVNKNKIDITIKVINDDKNYYVNKINIFGNSITIEDVIRNELIIDEGDPLNKVLFAKSINNIKSLGIFKNVTSKIVDTDNDFEKSINITVEEQPTGQVSLGAGVGTSGTSTSFGLQESNFLGKGIKLNSSLTLSDESIRGLFSYTKKNYNNSDKDLIFSVKSTQTDRLDSFGYKSTDTGFSIGTSYEYLEDFYFSPNFEIFYETLTTASSASSLLKKQEGSYFDSNIGYSLILDKRDQSYQPSDGYFSNFYQSLPLNIDENQTLVNSYELITFHEYIDNQVATLSIYGKAANSLGQNDVKISDRLYLPVNKLRGFKPGKIGPKDGGDWVGGNYLSALNAQANLPIFQTFETMDFNVFYDAANVWGVDYSSSIDDASTIRSATGLGIDWYTPIGPLSFSFAKPISQKSTDQTETFRFRLGTSF